MSALFCLGTLRHQGFSKISIPVSCFTLIEVSTGSHRDVDLRSSSCIEDCKKWVSQQVRKQETLSSPLIPIVIPADTGFDIDHFSFLTNLPTTDSIKTMQERFKQNYKNSDVKRSDNPTHDSLSEANEVRRQLNELKRLAAFEKSKEIVVSQFMRNPASICFISLANTRDHSGKSVKISALLMPLSLVQGPIESKNEINASKVYFSEACASESEALHALHTKFFRPRKYTNGAEKKYQRLTGAVLLIPCSGASFEFTFKCADMWNSCMTSETSPFVLNSYIHLRLQAVKSMDLHPCFISEAQAPETALHELCTITQSVTVSRLAHAIYKNRNWDVHPAASHTQGSRNAGKNVPVISDQKFADPKLYLNFFRSADRAKRENCVLRFYRAPFFIFMYTTRKCFHKRMASPFCDQNRVVLPGYLDYNGNLTIPEEKLQHREDMKLPPLDEYDVIVGHNLKFDLLWLWKDPELRRFLRRGGRVWDTMYAEYLLSGQRVRVGTGAGLNEVAVRYGGTRKLDAIKAMWDRGVDTADIDTNLLREYLEGDLRNTERIFRRQLEIAVANKQALVIEARMDIVPCTVEMEFNGLYVGCETIKSKKSDVAHKIQALRQRMNLGLTQFFGKSIPDGWCIDFDWNSAENVLELYLSNCSLSCDISFSCRVWSKEEVAASSTRLNTVKQKLHITDRMPLCYAVCPDPVERDEAFLDLLEEDGNATNNFKITLSDLLEICISKGCILSKDLREFRLLCRLSSSFMRNGKETPSSDPSDSGMFSLVHSSVSRLHTEFMLTSSVTTRMSARNPNTQSIPKRAEIRELLVSRFHSEGMMLEGDYSQLEVRALAALSGDRNLLNDLHDGVDFHCKRAAMISPELGYENILRASVREKDPGMVNLRQKAKVFSFQRQYGASPQTIAQHTSLSLDAVEKVIEAENATYADVERYFGMLRTIATHSAQILELTNKGASRVPTDMSNVFLLSGTRFHLSAVCDGNSTGVMMKTSESISVSNTQLRNYPVQGFAAEIVQVMLGKLWRHFVGNNNYGNMAFLTNTVHDSVWVDCHKSVIDTVANDVKGILASVSKTFQTTWPEIAFYDLMFPVTLYRGQNLHSLSRFELTNIL